MSRPRDLEHFANSKVIIMDQFYQRGTVVYSAGLQLYDRRDCY
ncbi:MAG: hypothetical protein ACTXOO_04965 [Sodalis sp. (in: enterobacteria)]